VAKVKVRAKTFAGYQDMLRRYIRAELRARLLATLGPMEIQTVYNKLSEPGQSARTVQYTHMILKQAIQWRLLVHNPCDGVNRGGRRVRKFRC
jgi:hypothetical protein